MRELGPCVAEKGNYFGNRALNAVFVRTRSFPYITNGLQRIMMEPWKAFRASVVIALNMLGINPPILLVVR